MNILIFIIISILLLGIVEFLKRSVVFSTDVLRRIAHLGAGAINIMAPLFIRQQEIILINIAFAILLLVGRKTKYFSAIQTTKRYSLGDVYLPLGIILVAILFLPDNILVFQFGVAIMGISDALAGLVGERWGKHKFPFFNTSKSIEGSLAFFISSVLITLVFLPQLSLAVIFIPIILTFIELNFSYGLDNLILPIASGLILSIFI